MIKAFEKYDCCTRPIESNLFLLHLIIQDVMINAMKLYKV